MVRLNSPWVKLPLLSLLVLAIALVFLTVPSSNSRAIGLVGLILLTEAYFLGIDTAIIGRIVKMKPLNRAINGLYYVVTGVILLITVALGAFAFFQWGFVIFVCLVGASILTYQVAKGPKWVFKDVQGAIALRQILEQKRRAKFEAQLRNKLERMRANSTPSQLAAFEADQRQKFEKRVRGTFILRYKAREYMVHAYFISIGSDLSVTVLGLAIFALMDFVTAILLFILGAIVRYVGDRIAKGLGVVKEVPLPEETAFK